MIGCSSVLVVQGRGEALRRPHPHTPQPPRAALMPPNDAASGENRAGDTADPADKVVVGSRVRTPRCDATIRFIGATKFAPGEWFGVEVSAGGYVRVGYSLMSYRLISLLVRLMEA